MYHSISNGNHNLSVSLKNFKKQMSFMKDNHYKSINFKDLNNLNQDNKYFIITFDDGYEDVYLNALPILTNYNFKAVCFFVPNFIGKYNIWDENKNNFIKLNLMNMQQIQNWYNSGMSIGGHTLGHKNLTKIDYQDKVNEIIGPKKFFHDKLSLNINSFSYPFGRFDNESAQIVKKNYDFAVTTKRSRYTLNKFELNELPRIPVNKTDSMFKFFLKIKTFYEDIKYNK